MSAQLNANAPASESKKVPPPIVCLPLMRIPAKVEKTTNYLPEMWRPDGSRNATR